MSIKNLWIFLGIFLVSHNSYAQEYSLAEAIKYGLDNSPAIQTADADVEIAESQIDQIVATGLPQINGSADLSYNFMVPTSFIPAILFDPSAEEGQFMPVQFGTEYNGQAAVNMKQMIFRGSYFVGLKAAKTYRKVAAVSKNKTEIDVVEDISKAYYGALIAREQMKFLEDNYARLDSLFTETQIMYENGFVEKIDVTRLKIQLNNMQSELDNSDEIVQISDNFLKFQMGMPINEKIELTESMSTLRIPEMNNIPENIDIENHVTIRELRNSEEFATWDMKNIQAQYYPSLDLYGSLGANVGTNSAGDYFNFNNNWFGLGMVGVQLSVPIFDGTYKSRVIQQKKLEVKKIQIAVEQTVNSLELRNRNTRIEYHKNLDKLTFQQENVELAREIFNTTKIKYEEGVGSYLELINADTSLKEAQTNYYNALYDLLVAKVELEKALGLLSTTEYK